MCKLLPLTCVVRLKHPPLPLLLKACLPSRTSSPKKSQPCLCVHCHAVFEIHCVLVHQTCHHHQVLNQTSNQTTDCSMSHCTLACGIHLLRFCYWSLRPISLDSLHVNISGLRIRLRVRLHVRHDHRNGRNTKVLMHAECSDANRVRPRCTTTSNSFGGTKCVVGDFHTFLHHLPICSCQVALLATGCDLLSLLDFPDRACDQLLLPLGKLRNIIVVFFLLWVCF